MFPCNTTVTVLNIIQLNSTFYSAFQLKPLSMIHRQPHKTWSHIMPLCRSLSGTGNTESGQNNNTFIVLIKPIPYTCTMLHHTHIYINIPYSDYKWLLIEHRKEFCWSACHVSLLLTVLNKAAAPSLYCQLLIMYQ